MRGCAAWHGSDTERLVQGGAAQDTQQNVQSLSPRTLSLMKAASEAVQLSGSRRRPAKWPELAHPGLFSDGSRIRGSAAW